MVATPVFDVVDGSLVNVFLGIYQNVFLWIVGTFKLLLDFMMSNPILAIALAIITVSAAVSIFKRVVR